MQETEESDIFQEQPLIKVLLKKLTEEPLRTKIVRRRKKVLAGKDRASIRALYLNLRVIYFSNFSNGFEIN